jgi:hypothetical protein
VHALVRARLDLVSMRHDVGAEFLTRAAGTMISEVSLLNGRVQIGGSVCPKIEKKASLVVHSCVRVKPGF